MTNVNYEKMSIIAKAISHPERAQIVELLSSEHFNVTEIMKMVGISQPKVSGHLSYLKSANIVESTRTGKEIIYSIVPETLEYLSSWIDNLAGLKKIKNYYEHQSSKNHMEADFSNARCCYDHLAGKIGVWLLQEFLRRSWLKVDSKEKPTFAITEAGITGLRSIGVTIPVKKKNGRIFAYGCRDVSERKLHLGGSLGSAIFKDLVSKNIVVKTDGTRALKVISPIEEWFEITT